MCTTREQQKHISTHTKLSVPVVQASCSGLLYNCCLDCLAAHNRPLAFGHRTFWEATSTATQPARKVGTLTESLQYSYSPAAGSGRCMWVPHGECATCDSVRGNANTSSAHRGGCKRGPRATRVLRSSKKQYNWELFFAASNIEVPLFRAAKASSYFFLLTNQRLWPPRPPQNLFSAGPQFR